MIPCAAFEDRLIEYAELPAAHRQDVDEHVAGCQTCHEYLALLREVDAALASEVRGIRMDPLRYDAIKRLAMSTPAAASMSRLPEWMDFVAAGAVCAFGYVLAWKAGIFDYLVTALSFD